MLIELDTWLIGPRTEDQKLGNATSLIASAVFEYVGVEFTLRPPPGTSETHNFSQSIIGYFKVRYRRVPRPFRGHTEN